MKEEINYIQTKINNKEYSILPDSIAINTVYKLIRKGSLEIDGYEIGYLYIPKGSGIKTHTHTNDIERYKLLDGTLVVNDESVNYNICLLNNSHNIMQSNKDTLIQTCKINKNNLNLLENNSNESFDKFIENLIH